MVDIWFLFFKEGSEFFVRTLKLCRGRERGFTGTWGLCKGNEKLGKKNDRYPGGGYWWKILFDVGLIL